MSSSWPTGRSLDGGLDRIGTPPGVGPLWLCGKHVVGRDPEAVRDGVGAGTVIVSFNRPNDIARYDGYANWLATSPNARWYPIPDFHAPPLTEALPMIDEIVGLLRKPGPVVMHCSAGMGRAGTMAVCVLMALGLSASAATERVAADRPGAGPEVGAQLDLIAELALHLRVDSSR